MGQGEKGGRQCVFCVGEEFQQHGQVTLVVGKEDGDVFLRWKWEWGDEGNFFPVAGASGLEGGWRCPGLGVGCGGCVFGVCRGHRVRKGGRFAQVR